MLVRCCNNSGTGIYAELTHEQLRQVWRGEIDQDIAEALARFQSRAVLEGREIARSDYHPLDETEERAGRKELKLGHYPDRKSTRLNSSHRL